MREVMQSMSVHVCHSPRCYIEYVMALNPDSRAAQRLSSAQTPAKHYVQKEGFFVSKHRTLIVCLFASWQTSVKATKEAYRSTDIIVFQKPSNLGIR